MARLIVRLGLGFASDEGTCAAIRMGGWRRGGLFVSLGFYLGLVGRLGL